MYILLVSETLITPDQSVSAGAASGKRRKDDASPPFHSLKGREQRKMYPAAALPCPNVIIIALWERRRRRSNTGKVLKSASPTNLQRRHRYRGRYEARSIRQNAASKLFTWKWVSDSRRGRWLLSLTTADGLLTRFIRETISVVTILKISNSWYLENT